MRFPEIAYMSWAKRLPRAAANLARSGVEPCPRALLRLRPRDFAIQHPAGYGYRPLREALARRYGVDPDGVLSVSGGASLANWLAAAAALDGAPPGAEVIVERPTYEPLLRIAQALGGRVRRLERRFESGWAIDWDRFAALVTRRTRLAIVSNLHNPTGARIPHAMLRAMAERLRRVGAYLLVDEVYLEELIGSRTASSVHAGPNVLATNSLTKAYGLDGLRAGWILGPRRLIRRAGTIYDLIGVNPVSPAEQLALAALRRLPALRRRSQAILRPNRATLAAFFAHETRLDVVLPAGGNVAFPRLPAPLRGRAVADHLRRRHDTLIVPGEFFEAPRHVRISFGCTAGPLKRGLARLELTLDELLT